MNYLSGPEQSLILAENEIKAIEQAFTPKMGELNWIDDDDNNTLSVSTETNEPIAGNGSLRVDIKPTTTINATNNASWSMITTDFIPAIENALYNYSLEVSAEHVNQLHPKVYYYNLSKMSISENFISGGKDGTFEERYNNSFLSPTGTKFLQFQMWVKPTTGRNASYLIDNVNLGQNKTYSLDNLQNITERQPLDHSAMQLNGSMITDNLPVILNNNSYFSIERIFTGLNFPTSMAFLAPDDILVLEKNQGIVKRIVNGTVFGDPLLDVNVGTKAERGMLGIDISMQKNDGSAKPTVYVFLYYTETKQRDGEDDVSSRHADVPGQGPLGNRLYRYELVDNKLINPKLLIDLPAEPKPNHQGGVVQIGPDNNVYMIIGDVDHFTQAQNYKDGDVSDGTGGILMISQNGKVIEDGILGDSYPLNLYYAYGIRNSFGFDFDPVTGNLWDTENGLRCCDEINMVEKGFNSGWDKVQGFWETNHSQKRDRDGIFDADSTEGLVTFDDNGKYSSPEFVWNMTVAPTAIKFFNSTRFGQEYKDDLFVGTANDQKLYHFDLNKDRTELILSGDLSDKIMDGVEDLETVVFGDKFGRITDIELGPDGNLYVLSNQGVSDKNFKNGSIFKISRSDDLNESID